MGISRFFLFFVVFLLSLMMNTAAVAGDRIAGRSDRRTRPLNSAEFILAATDNPWVPSPTQRADGFPHYYNAKKDNPFQPQQMNRSPIYNSRNSSHPYYRYPMQPRYVTPAILKSIRKQQMRAQQILPSWQRYPYPYQRYPYQKRNYWQYNPSPNRYGRGGDRGNSLGNNPGNSPENSPENSYGNWSANPALPVSPGTLLDKSLLDGNGGLPLTPDMTAIEGISPLNANEPLPPELSGNNYDSSGRYFDPMAFNPSSMFGPFDNFAR